MDKALTAPRTLQEAIRYFTDPDVCLAFMLAIRWPEGVRCPTCGTDAVQFIRTRRLWQCREKHPRRQFSAKVGTIFEDSPIGLDKWFAAMWMIANCKNGVSSYEIGRALDVTQKTAWFMNHRLRLAMHTQTFEQLSGHVEADETYIGGKARNMPAGSERRQRGRLMSGKAVIAGLLERKGRVRAAVVPNVRKGHIQAQVRQHVAAGSILYTDALKSYEGLAGEYAHKVIDHAEAYARGLVHTNGLENFWSLLKRGLKGTYVSVEPFHLFRYLDEQVFRYNERGDNDGGRFLKVLRTVVGRRLTYADLTMSPA